VSESDEKRQAWNARVNELRREGWTREQAATMADKEIYGKNAPSS
jgi:hypothetical protein